MGNVYQLPNGDFELDPSVLEEDDWDSHSDTNSDTDVVKLLEENARLRALVVQLSGLVLKNIAEQK